MSDNIPHNILHAQHECEEYSMDIVSPAKHCYVNRVDLKINYVA